MNPLAEKILNRTRAVPLAVATLEQEQLNAEEVTSSYASSNEVFPHSAIDASNAAAATEVTEADLGLAFLASLA